MMFNNFSKDGSIPAQTLEDMMEAGFIKNASKGNIRPASLDLSISDEIYKVDGIFQPKDKETVRQVLGKLKKEKHSISKPLKRGEVYLIRLNEKLDLPR